MGQGRHTPRSINDPVYPSICYGHRNIAVASAAEWNDRPGELTDASVSLFVFTTLHRMQTRSSDEHSVCPSVRLSHA